MVVTKLGELSETYTAMTPADGQVPPSEEVQRMEDSLDETTGFDTDEDKAAHVTIWARKLKRLGFTAQQANDMAFLKLLTRTGGLEA